MDLLNVLALLIFSSNSLGGNSPEYLNFGDEDFNEDEVKNNNFTPDIKELTHLERSLLFGFPLVDSSEVPRFEDAQDDYRERNEEDEPDTPVNSNLLEKHLLSGSLPLNEETAEKYLLNRLFKEQPYDFEEYYHDEEQKPNQTPMRRQVNSWGASDEFLDSNNIPWSLEASYPKTGSSNVQSEYPDENYSSDTEQRNASFAGELEGNYQVEPPQYYQKNYYYNYYPLVRGRYDQRKYRAQKLDEILDSEETNKHEKFYDRKVQRKNPCKLYLQFLKYAFEELDKNSEYYYDSKEEIADDWRDREADGSHRVFATQLLGPTLYIDNSGRVFQVNSKGNSIQTVEGISPSSKVSSLEKDFAKPKLTTLNSPREYRTETSTSQPLHNSFIITYANTENSNMNEKESQTVNPHIKLIKEDTYPSTISTEKATTVTESSPFLTTSSASKPALGDYYERPGLNWPKPSEIFNKSNSSIGSSLYLRRQSSTPSPTSPSVSSDKNHFRSETLISFENSSELKKKKDVDCNDKMLPCPDTVNITYPLNGYCNRYVSCESGIAVRRTCMNGFHFNIITKSCDFPHNSICSYYCPEPNGYYGIPGDCSGYFICENSVPEYRMCPPRMHWDVRISSCTFAAISSCPMKCSSLNEIKPYTGDCKAYIICLKGIPYYHKCPPNLVYSSENQTCVPKSQYNCKDDFKLMTKTSNPSSLCRDVDQKLGTKAWCSYHFSPENENHKDTEKY